MITAMRLEECDNSIGVRRGDDIVAQSGGMRSIEVAGGEVMDASGNQGW